MDVQRSLRTAVQSGKVLIGADQAAKAIGRGEARLVILANNCPAATSIKEVAGDKRVPVYDFKGLGTQLGPACGKPFSISALAILDAGESDILQLAK